MNPFKAPVDHRIMLAYSEVLLRWYHGREELRYAEMGERIRRQLAPAVVEVARPVVIVAMRDATAEQVSSGAVALDQLAHDCGWLTRITYACAMSDGSTIESCCVRLQRSRARGFASWRRVDGGGWSFEHAWMTVGSVLQAQRFGWTKTKKSDKWTIREIVASNSTK